MGNDMDKEVKKLEAKVKECKGKSVEKQVKYSKTSRNRNQILQNRSVEEAPFSISLWQVKT